MKSIFILFNLTLLGSTLLATETDTTKFKFGATRVIIYSDSLLIQGDDTTKVGKDKPDRVNKWAGVDLGVNGFLSIENEINLPEEAKAFDLDYAKSISVGINIIEKYIPIAQEKFGITTGLGFQFNSYAMDRDLVFSATDDTILSFVDSSRSIEKTRMKTTYLQAPLLLETNLGKSKDKSFHLAVGMLFGYRIGSKIKQVYEQDGREYKIKDKDDLNINPFRASLTARIGYGDFTIFANYGLTPFFEDGKGPEMYPFSLGLSLVSF